VFTRPGRRLAGSSDARLGPMAMGAGGGRGPFGTDGCGSPFLRDRWLWESVPSGPMVVGARPFGTDACGNPSLRDRWLWEPVPSGPMLVGARPFGTGGCVILLLPCATRSTALTKSVIVFPSRRGRAASGPNASPAVPRWPSASRRRAAADTL
jgi:hypothetical protein